MVSLILALHLRNQKIPWGEGVEHRSFMQATDFYTDQIATFDSGSY